MFNKQPRGPVVEHEILRVLYNKADFTVTNIGSAAKGHRPLYKRDYKMSYLDFGTLGDMLHHPDKYKDSEYNRLSRLKSKTIEEVGITKDDWIKISNAIDVLSTNGHVQDDTTNLPVLGLDKRTIKLTPAGTIAFIKRHYEIAEEKQIKELRALTTSISSNLVNRVSLPLTVIFAALAFAVSFRQCNKKEAVYHEDIKELRKSIQQLQLNKPKPDTVYIQSQKTGKHPSKI